YGCAAVDRHQALAARTRARRVFLDTRHGEGAGRLDDRARVLEYILNGCTDLIRVDEHDLIHMLAGEREAFLADALHRNAVGKHTDALERHAPPHAQRFVHRCRVLGFDTDDLDLRIQILDVHGNAADETAAADRHKDRIYRAAALAQDLNANGALARDH